jgi:hypothetical protein
MKTVQMKTVAVPQPFVLNKYNKHMDATDRVGLKISANIEFRYKEKSGGGRDLLGNFIGNR